MTRWVRWGRACPGAGWRLAALLLPLHLALLAGFDAPVGRMLLTAHFGMFLLWQPMVAGSRRLGGAAALLLLAGLVGFQFFLSWISLSIWLGLLAAVVAAQAAPRGGRTRLPEIIGFAYLTVALLAWTVPAGLPGGGADRDLLARVAAGSGVVAIVSCAMLAPRGRRLPTPDFLTATVVVLALGGIVLAALAYMFLAGAEYASALVRAVASVAAVLVLLGWMWSPREGFAGVSLLLSRRALAEGVSLEAWLRGVAAQARSARDPADFVARAARAFLAEPGVVGVRWSCAEAPDVAGEVGRAEGVEARFEHAGLVLVLRTRLQPDSPQLWRCDLMVRILAEFLVARRQAQALAEVGYLRAVHETGARITHDVKNLLQSLEGLLFALEHGFDRDPLGTRALVMRQLPGIAARLRQSLDKLRRPDEPGAAPARQALHAWWAAAVARQGGAGVRFEAVSAPDEHPVPGALLDRFLDNALQNALAKRATDPWLTVTVRLDPDEGPRLSVEDSGEPVPAERAARLLREPVQSEVGLGIGLLQVAREAAACGWTLVLDENRSGCVRFSLSGPGVESAGPVTTGRLRDSR